ncbi:MAG: hypothetical protein N2589_00660 [bacterium]|nr:hypothetical protein [bacterium]
MGHLCILWHFHQPYYPDIEEKINYTSITTFRTLQNYYPMGLYLEKFDGLKINFNITPSLLKQIKLISDGEVEDIFLNIFNYDLTPEQLIYFYNEFPIMFLNKKLQILKEKIEMGFYEKKDIIDFKVWLHLICFNNSIINEKISYLFQKGGEFNEKDIEILVNEEKKIFKNIIPLYQNLLKENKIEISTSPFYHPILPLIYDTEIMKKTKTKFKPINIRFSYPEDAEEQIEKAILYFKEIFGTSPQGIWPSEGGLSDDVLDLLIKKEIKWTATDEILLFETLNNKDKRNIYKCYKYKNKISIFFRDHYLSDLIGFYYQKMKEENAAVDFINKIEKILEENSEGIITVILDGENPWDYYPEKGVKFLKTFYEQLQQNKKIKTTTFSEIIKNFECKNYISNIFPGSWMGPYFDNWIGSDSANRGWKILKEVREKVKKSDDKLVKELILNAEGSDWFWWYSLDVDEKIKSKFDRYFKKNIRKIYEKLNLPIPEEIEEKIVYQEKVPFIRPIIDGKITNFYEWKDAIEIKSENLWMSFKPFSLPIKKFFYGYDDKNLYFRFDCETNVSSLKIIIDEEIYEIKGKEDFLSNEKIEYNWDEILEVKIKRSSEKKNYDIQIQVLIENYNFFFPPYGKISIIIKEDEWIV